LSLVYSNYGLSFAIIKLKPVKKTSSSEKLREILRIPYFPNSSGVLLHVLTYSDQQLKKRKKMKTNYYRSISYLFYGRKYGDWTWALSPGIPGITSWRTELISRLRSLMDQSTPSMAIVWEIALLNATT
jgi:hypothetical protein